MSSLFRIVLALTGLLVLCEAPCPHPNFLNKHMCTYCNNNANDAHRFALQADAWRRSNHRPPTGQNSVFVSNNMGYHQVNDPRNGWVCVFNHAAPKYNCLARTGWGCRHVADVVAVHSSRNGHYFY